MAVSEVSNRGIRDYFLLKDLPFWTVHVLAVGGVVVSGWSWSGFALALGSYYFRMFFITGAYHRYFSHRTYKTTRWFQFVLAFFGGTAAQKSALWWAAHHRIHHRKSDQPDDPHSPRQHGLLWSHMGWILSNENETLHADQIPDLMKYPELRALSGKFDMLPAVLYGAAMFFLFGGWHGLLWGMFVSTVLLWHGTFTINSLSHVLGRVRYDSGDDSKNNWLLALVTMGEGWHNNHHHYQSSVNQGFYWWEIDLSYYVLRVLSMFGLVWDLRKPPQRVLDEGRQPRPAPAPAE